VSRRGRELTPDEKKLWRRVAAHVKTRKPLPADDVEAPAKTTLRAKPRAVVSPAPAIPKPARAPVAPPADRGTEKRVRRGKLEIGASLDLHGHTQESARNALARFLHGAQARGDRTVIVITGVGRSGQGVLKQRLPEWLAERDLRALTSGFAQAHRTHGGAGAYYVFLKRPRE
jgi:DNA-nicking Smr family endonuclease